MSNLEPKLRGGVYYAVGTINKRRIRQSLGTRDAAKASELCTLYEARIWKRDSYGEEAVRTFEEAAIDYMTAGGERKFLAPIIAHFRGRVLGSIKPQEIRNAAQALYPGRKPATWNRNAIVPARAVIMHANGLGWCAPIKVKNFPVEKVRRRAADRAWLDAFVEAADRDGLPHLSACVMFMWQTAARVGEAVQVLPEHIDLAGLTVTLASTKTDEWVPVSITRELMLRLANLPMRKDTPVFGYASRSGPYHRMKAVCRRAGLPMIPPHSSGRHSYATNALARGATPKEVMEGGRWKTARMVLEIYAHAEDAGRKIADLFDADRAQSKTKALRKPAISRKN